MPSGCPTPASPPAQEAHAAMCEKLGITRCRITGMRYSLVNERDVSASLELKLDPAIARAFGKDATKVVTDAEGMLVDQQISGVDAGASIERANRGRAELQDELDRVNRELARPGLSNVVRDRLLSEAAVAALADPPRSASRRRPTRSRSRRRRWRSIMARATRSPASTRRRRSGTRSSAPATISSARIRLPDRRDRGVAAVAAARRASLYWLYRRNRHRLPALRHRLPRDDHGPIRREAAPRRRERRDTA